MDSEDLKQTKVNVRISTGFYRNKSTDEDPEMKVRPSRRMSTIVRYTSFMPGLSWTPSEKELVH